MKNNYLLAITLSTLLFLGAGQMSPATAAKFDDPNVNAMHASLDLMRAKAEKGDPEAQNSLGMLGLYGFGGKQDLGAAKGWFEKAANQGYPDAFVQLGNLYENGLGVEKDAAKAVNFYRKAAELNYPQGRFRLALLMLDGTGLAKNEAEGEKLLRSACDNGYRTSCGVLMWRENKLAEARAAFNLQCQAGDQLACGFQSQIGPAGADEGQGGGGDRGQGGVGIYLVIGLVLVGLLIFWLIRNDPGEEEEKEEKLK
jgi:hypothetical protein